MYGAWRIVVHLVEAPSVMRKASLTARFTTKGLRCTQVYTKDLTFLLRLLGSSKQSGILLVEAPGPNESPWQGRFQLNSGMVISCVLLNKADGRAVLRNEEALAWITSQ